MIKWIGLSLGVLVGVSHIAMIGMISQQNKKEGLPVVNIRVIAVLSKQMLRKMVIRYPIRQTNPKTAYITKDIKEKAGFLGLSNNTTKVVEEYFMDGKTNQGGAVSNKRSWLAPYQSLLTAIPNSQRRI